MISTRGPFGIVELSIVSPSRALRFCGFAGGSGLTETTTQRPLPTTGRARPGTPRRAASGRPASGFALPPRTAASARGPFGMVELSVELPLRVFLSVAMRNSSGRKW